MKLGVVGYQCLSPLQSPPGPANFRSILPSITASLRSAFSAVFSQKLKFEKLDCKPLFCLFLKNAFVVLLLCLNLIHHLNSYFSLAHHTCLQLELCRFLVSLINSASWLLVYLFIFLYFLSLSPCLTKSLSDTCVSEDVPDS